MQRYISRFNTIIVIEITPGHNYRWHATTKNYAYKPGYLAVVDYAGPRRCHQQRGILVYEIKIHNTKYIMSSVISHIVIIIMCAPLVLIHSCMHCT